MTGWLRSHPMTAGYVAVVALTEVLLIWRS